MKPLGPPRATLDVFGRLAEARWFRWTCLVAVVGAILLEIIR